MDIFEIPAQIDQYTEALTTAEDKVLQELYRTTYLQTVHPQMLSGKVQGQFISMISQILRPKNILEIGTFTGYSAYCLQKGLQSEGKLISIEVNEELEDLVRGFILKAGLQERIELLIGDALDIIPKLDMSFDLVFIDANKEHYPAYYEAIIDKVNPGGLLIADNVLWGGKVVKEHRKDQSSRVLHAFNQMVLEDPRVENVILTIRDGLNLIRKVQDL